MDELEDLHADRTNICFLPLWKLRARVGSQQGGNSVTQNLIEYILKLHNCLNEIIST